MRSGKLTSHRSADDTCKEVVKITLAFSFSASVFLAVFFFTSASMLDQTFTVNALVVFFAYGKHCLCQSFCGVVYDWYKLCGFFGFLCRFYSSWVCLYVYQRKSTCERLWTIRCSDVSLCAWWDLVTFPLAFFCTLFPSPPDVHQEKRHSHTQNEKDEKKNHIPSA